MNSSKKNRLYQSTTIISTAGITLPKATAAISKAAAAISKATAAISKASTAISRATAAVHCNHCRRHINHRRSRHHSYPAITAIFRIVATIITATNTSY
jgi:hypothetical protein